MNEKTASLIAYSDAVFLLCFYICSWDTVTLAEFRRGHADVLSEYTVKLGETGKTALGTCFGDGDLGTNQQGLYISDSGHLNVVR